MKQRIVVTGGNGYIGTAVVDALVSAGHSVTVVDESAPTDFMSSLGVEYVMSDYVTFFQNSELEYSTVIHLAANHVVSQSVSAPAEFYDNNVIKTKQMLDLIRESSIKNIIFSSTGSVYGNRHLAPKLNEDHHMDPVNPYASTKIACEHMIRDYATAYGIKYVIFRFFNAGGADEAGRFGYTQTPATHVIPIMCKALLSGTPFTVYGNDYNTDDGTCMRDYVHIKDIARAHLKGLDYIIDNPSEIVNLGGSSSTSVLQLVKIAESMGQPFSSIVFKPRRQGDPHRLVANITKAHGILGWKPTYTVTDMVQHSMKWETTMATKASHD